MSDSSNNIAFSENELAKLFPFNFTLNVNLEVTSIGPSLKKLILADYIQKPFADVFNLVKPSHTNLYTQADIEKILGNFIILSPLENPHAFLKGQIEFRNSTNQYTFFGSIWVDEFEVMRKMGVTYSDFPAYDAIFDIQQMRSILINEREDIEKLRKEINIINHSSDLFITLHHSGLIKKASPSSLSILGLHPHELIGHNFQDYIVERSELNIKQEIKQIINEGISREYVTFLKSNAGNEIGIGMSLTPVSLEHKIAPQIVCVIRDISQRIHDLDEIRNLASFPNENPNPIFRVDGAGNILFFNKSAAKIETINFENEKYDIHDFWMQFFKHERTKHLKELDAEVDNSIINFRIIEREDSEEKNIYGSDITIRIESEQKAHENFTRLNAFLESTNDVYYLLYQKKTNKNFYTSRWPLFFGFNPSEFIAWTEKRECVLDEHKNRYDEAIRNLQINGSMSVKYQLVNKISGHVRWVLEESKIKFDSIINDEVISGRITDITASENFRSQIKESEERFQLVTESMPVMIWVSNEDDKVIYTNKTSRDFYGIDLTTINSAEEFSQYVHPDYHKTAIHEWAEKIKAKESAEVQYLAKNKYGEYRWIYEIAIPRFMDNKQYLGYIGTGFDITSERRMFYKLEEEKKKYELLSNQSADIIFLVDNMGIVEYVSPSIKRILGFDEKSMIGNSLFNMLKPQGELSINDFKQEENKLSNKVLSFHVKDAHGETKWVEAAYNTFKEENLGIEKIVIHLRDINDQYIAQNMLIENEAKYRNLFSNMNLGIMEVDTNEKILYLNSSFERISGYSQDELLGKIAPEIFITEISEKEISLQERRNREHGKEGLYELRIKRKDGKNATWVISGAPTYDLKGKIRGSIGIHWDVTEIRDLESKILFESVQKEKELMEARLQAEEEQRDTIGRDLHDGVGQMLAYLSVYMNILKEKENINPTDVEKAQTTIKKTIDEVRRLARNLAPPAIKDLGLRDAIVELIGSYAIIPKPAFNLKIYKGKDPSKLQYEQKIMLFRVLQELSSNTFKYAKAEKVDIKIDYNKSGLEMTYIDNGIGFDMSTIKKGIGLKSILSRVEFYGGIVKINTKVNQGTEVIIKLPFE